MKPRASAPGVFAFFRLRLIWLGFAVFMFPFARPILAQADDPCAPENSVLAQPVSWNIEEGRRVLAPGQLFGEQDATRVAAGHVLRLGDRFRMYYWGAGNDGFNRICIAESPVDDPNAWEPVGIALERQPDSEYNSIGPGFPFVLPRDDGPWLMYYCGWGEPPEPGRVNNSTGVALSDDQGLTWRYHETHPVLPFDQPYDQQGTGSVWVVRSGDVYEMFYTSLSNYYAKPEGVVTGHGDVIPDIGIGYARSTDGLVWEKPLKHLLLTPRRFGALPYEYIVSKPCIIRDGAGFRMWVNTFSDHYRIRSLWSPNGKNWVWNASCAVGELGVGPEGAFDDEQRSYLTVVKDGDVYHGWYTGNQYGLEGIGYLTGRVETQ